MFFLQDLSNSFHRWFNLSIYHFGVSQQFTVVCNSQIMKTEEEFSLNLAPFSSRFVVLVQGHPLIIVFDCQNSFYPSGVIQSIFSLILRSPSSHNYSFPAFSYRSPNLTGASIKYSLLSLSSLHSPVSKFTQVSSSHLLIISGDLYFCFFLEKFLPWFTQDYIPWLSYQLIRCFPNSTGGSLKTFSSWRYIYLNLFYENK